MRGLDMREDLWLLKGRRLTALLSLLLCVACVSKSQAKLVAEGRQLVQAGILLSAAVERLTGAQFTCDDKSIAGAVTCTRIRN